MALKEYVLSCFWISASPPLILRYVYEPPPIGYRITNVSRTHLSDGIFHHGKTSATHKCVAKQLEAIKRTLNDPVAPPRELDQRLLDRSINRETEGFVDPPGADDGKVFETLNMMPRISGVQRSASQPSCSIFPRSQQYELWQIRDRRLKNGRKFTENFATTMVECTEGEQIDKVAANGEACGYFKSPFWWSGGTARSRGLPVGDIDEYAYEKLQEPEQDNRKISEKLQMDHPKKYMPGAIHRLQSPGVSKDKAMKEILDEADAFEVTLKIDEELPKYGASVVECSCPSPVEMPIVHTKLKDDTDKRFSDSDARWQLVDDAIGYTGTDLERQAELRKFSKAFLHELHKWYSDNKPTKLAQPARRHGKRPIPVMRFSHL